MSSNNNNKKRDNTEDGNQEDNDNNKKQKLDNSNVGEDVEIDVANLPKQKVVQLKEIATSIGLQIKSGIRKNEIIEMIKNLHKRKQEIIAKATTNSNINPFNKGVTKFTITDGVEESEWLFWKIFRNKFIYRRIMSFMDTHLSIYPPYDSIVSVKEMIANNQLSILRDKVVRNQYLVIKDGLVSIFSAIRNNKSKEDVVFYEHLFELYGKYSMDFEKVQLKDSVVIRKESGHYHLVSNIIKASCLPALKVMVEKYNFKPDISIVNNLILLNGQNDSIKIIKYLYQPNFFIEGIPDTSKVSNIKLLYFFFIRQKLLKNENLLKDKLKSVTIDPTYSLKSLILVVKMVVHFNTLFGESPLLTLESIDTISKQFTPKELSMELSNQSFQNKVKKGIVKILLDIYYSFDPTREKPHFYSLYFTDDEESEKDIPLVENESLKLGYFILSIQFGSLITLNSISNKSNYGFKEDWDLVLSKPDSSFIEPNFIFSNCPETLKQMAFIERATPLVIDNFKFIDSTLFFYLIIYNNNLDQIKFVSNQLKSKINVISDKTHYIITNYIKSELVLGWLFENYTSHFKLNPVVVFHFQSTKLLKYYEDLYESKFGNPITIKSSRDRKLETNRLFTTSKFEVLKHIFGSGPTVYKFGPLNFYMYIYNSICSNQEKLELCKLVYKNFKISPFANIPVKYDKNNLFYQITNSSNYIKFIDWIYNNHKNEFSEFIEPNIDDERLYFIYHLLLKIGKYQDVKIEKVFLEEIKKSEIDDTRLISYYLSSTMLLSSPNKFEKERMEAIEGCIRNGRAQTIEFIQINHKNILEQKSKLNPFGFFPSGSLKRILGVSLSTDNLELSEHLSKFFKLTRTEFNYFSNGLSKHHFDDQF